MKNVIATLHDRYLQLGDSRIHYLEAGMGDRVVLLIHGGGSDCAQLSWSPIIPALARRHWVLAPDLPGFGSSDLIPMTHPIFEMAAQLHSFLDRLHVNSCHLMGLSIGGAIALAMYFSYPKRICSLTLLASYGLGNYLPGGRWGYLAAQIPLLPHIIRGLMRTSPRFLRFALRQVLDNPVHISPILIQEMRSQLKQQSHGKGWHQFLYREISIKGLRTVFSTEQLKTIEAPVLLIHGTNDRLIPFPFSQQAAQIIPFAHLHLIPNCGHWIPREIPHKLIYLMESFLESVKV